MSQQSADSQTLTDDQKPEAAAKSVRLPASIAHQWLTLIGATFLVFELFFLECYSDNFWFSLNLMSFGLLAMLCSAGIAYVLLRLAETKLVHRIASPIWKGCPPVLFRHWLQVDESGLQYGLRHVQWSALDELNLTWMGNCLVKSRALCGASEDAEVVLKFPFGIGSQQDQNRLLDIVRTRRSDLVVNDRLLKRLNSPIVKGQNAIQLLGAVMMTVILVDVGQSSSYYLEMLKHYYLAETAAVRHDMKQADKELAEGDNLRSHPFPVSYVTPRFLSVGSSAAGLLEARANALWAMDRKQDAIADARKATELTPDSFRTHLHLARYLSGADKHDEAREAIGKAIEHHKDSLLPRLYMVASARATKPEQVKTFYQQSLSDLQDSTFESEPVWPPGGSRFVHDVFYKDDVYFIFDRLLGIPSHEIGAYDRREAQDARTHN